MIKKLSKKFTNVLVENKIIESDDFEIYRYGFEALIYFTINISLALFIGIIFDRFIHTIIFLSCYCTLRQFTGGYHARNYTECTLTFVVIYLITIFVANNIDIYRYKYLLVLLMIASVLIIYKLAPLENRSKPLNDRDKRHYKNIAISIIVIISSMFFISTILGILREYFTYSVLAIIWICLLLILGFYINLSID